jgi:hypothetical protein
MRSAITSGMCAAPWVTDFLVVFSGCMRGITAWLSAVE